MFDNQEELAGDNTRRIELLARQGRQVLGVREHYIVSMLEHLAGDAVPLLRLEHELWLAGQLDGVEKTVREQAFTNLGKQRN